MFKQATNTNQKKRNMSTNAYNDYLKKLHNDILKIMDEIDRICKKNKLSYYLIGGSLLGAVRHQGFIPWDDDLDIAMPRDDYERFVDLCAKELSPDCYLLWHTTEREYWRIFAKVCLKDTLYVEKQIKERQYGIFVDIFPLDFCNGYSEQLQYTHIYLKRLSNCIYFKNTTFNGKIKSLPLFLLSFIIPSNIIIKLFDNKCKSLKKAGQSHYAMFPTKYAIKKQTFPVEWFGKGTYLPFEGRTYQCPINSPKVLELTFGKDYMQLPPLECRETHTPAKVVFFDKSSYCF